MNQNIFSAYQEHLAYPKFRHAFKKWRIIVYALTYSSQYFIIPLYYNLVKTIYRDLTWKGVASTRMRVGV